jgi:hypothetical protein
MGWPWTPKIITGPRHALLLYALKAATPKTALSCVAQKMHHYYINCCCEAPRMKFKKVGEIWKKLDQIKRI